MVDNLKIAQFIYQLLNNAEIREVINTIISKAVLDAIRDELRKQGYLSILFDFQKPVVTPLRKNRTGIKFASFPVASAHDFGYAYFISFRTQKKGRSR